MAQYKGQVKWFNNAKGFGFLGREEGPDLRGTSPSKRETKSSLTSFRARRVPRPIKSPV